MHRFKPSRMSACTLAVCLSLAGCTTVPVVSWNGGDPASAGASMPGALRYLDSARTQYRKAVAAQMRDERALGNALIGAGALVAALAVGNVHRDAIIGTSFLAGTGYAIGNANLQRPRVLIYQAGVEALNCAERAVAPFAIDEPELQGLLKAVDALDAARLALSARIAEGQALRDRALPTNIAASDFDALLPAVQELLPASDATLRAGREFAAAARTGARQLVAAVNGIDAAVVRSLINETPDLSSVPKVISGLAGLIGSFAPGADIEGLVAQRLGDFGKVRSAAEGQRDALDVANAAIRLAARDLAARHAEAAGRLAGRTAAWPEDAFKECGVAQVVAALSASPDSLQFIAGLSSRRLLDITGGVKPYFVEFDGPAVDGLVLKPPVRFDTRAEITLDGARVQTPVETSLRISDSSPTARTLNLPLSVAAAPAPARVGRVAAPPARSPAPVSAPVSAPAPSPSAPVTPSAAPPPAQPGTGTATANAIARMSKFNFGGKEFRITGSPRLVGDTVNVDVQCPQGSTETFTRFQLTQALLSQAGLSTTPPLPKLVIETMPPTCAAP